MERLKRGYRGLHCLWLHDEAPRLGSGNRLAEITVGNRRVKLRCPITGRTSYMLRTIFDDVWSKTMGQRLKPTSCAILHVKGATII